MEYLINERGWQRVAIDSSQVVLSERDKHQAALNLHNAAVGDDDISDDGPLAGKRASLVDELKRVNRLIKVRAATRQLVEGTVYHIATIPDGNCFYNALFAVLTSLRALPIGVARPSQLKQWLMTRSRVVDVSKFAAWQTDDGDVDLLLIASDLTTARGANEPADVNILSLCAHECGVRLHVTLANTSAAGDVVSCMTYHIGNADTSKHGRLMLYDRHYDACIDYTAARDTVPPLLSNVHENFGALVPVAPERAAALRAKSRLMPNTMRRGFLLAAAARR